LQVQPSNFKVLADLGPKRIKFFINFGLSITCLNAQRTRAHKYLALRVTLVIVRFVAWQKRNISGTIGRASPAEWKTLSRQKTRWLRNDMVKKRPSVGPEFQGCTSGDRHYFCGLGHLPGSLT
jgi:hypothetical protein